MSLPALRSLLLASQLSVSTQQAVRTAKAAPYRLRLVLACWAWLLAALLVAGLAVVGGGALTAVASAAALAMAPALVGFVLWPWLARAKWADVALIVTWLIAVTGLIAGTGGASSPLAAALIVAPTLALGLGRRWVPEAGAAAVLAFVVAAFLARSAGAPADLAAFPEMLAAAAIAFAAGVMALTQTSARPGNVMGARIAEVSHELRTPLTHILGFSEMIERQIFGPLGDRYVEYAGLIRRSGNHLLSLVNDLLDLSKIDAGRFELERATFDIRALIEDVVRLSADSAQKKSIALGMTTPDAPLTVNADERALRRILMNTLGNALKFTPEGGRVIVTAAVHEGVLQLDTIDNGPGIPEAERERLGHAFERGESGARAEGTGLGLSLVRALAGLHGGALSFHDAPGGGALVRVTLPVVAV